MNLEKLDFIPARFDKGTHIMVLYTPEVNTTIRESKEFLHKSVVFEGVTYKVVGVENYAIPEDRVIKNCGFLLKRED